jgi:hypothetical protein
MRRLTAALLIVAFQQTPVDLLKEARAKLDAALEMLSSSVITIPPTGDPQAALDSAKPGSTLILSSGASYASLVVRTDQITLTSSGPLDPEGVRIIDATGMATVRGTDTSPAIQVTSKHVKVIGIEAVGTGTTTWPVVQQTESATDTTFDRMYVHGDVLRGTKRGVELNGVDGKLINSVVFDIKRSGQDTQAVSGTQGSGPYTIHNNDLQAAGENIIFGGDDPRTKGVVPSDISIKGNHVWKPLTWRGTPDRWQIKNLIELKNAQRVFIEDNTFEGSWVQAQTGFGAVFTVRNQDGACEWCVVKDVVFQRNTMSKVAGAVNIQAVDNEHPSQKSINIYVLNNNFNIDNPGMGGGNGRTFQILAGPTNLTVKGNIVKGLGINSIFNFDNEKLVGLVVSDNFFQEGSYGIFASNGLGKVALDFVAPGYVWSNNTVTKWPNGRTIKYPEGTSVVLP